MKYFLWIILFGWVLISLFLHITPSPETWGHNGSFLVRAYSEDREAFQMAAHALMMGVLSLILMRLLRSGTRVKVTLTSLGLTLSFAVAMELLQGLMPHAFKRECDPADLLPALLGALLGCAAGLLNWHAKD